MGNLLSSILDFLSVLFIAGFILLFSGEIRLALVKQASKGSTNMQQYTSKLTGSSLDLSDKRVYGK